jgi:RNA polymerase-interacting CarD/CdnL/TRCF family regulator
MEFHAGEHVMHSVHGLGKVLQREKRAESNDAPFYYVVEVRDMTIWVPEDETLEKRLRRPTPSARFKSLLQTLSEAGEALPDDRHQRKILLSEWLKGGDVEALFRVIRGLSTFKRIRPLNDNDQLLLKRLETSLVAEWALIMAILPVDATLEMHRLLALAPDGSIEKNVASRPAGKNGRRA